MNTRCQQHQVLQLQCPLEDRWAHVNSEIYHAKGLRQMRDQSAPVVAAVELSGGTGTRLSKQITEAPGSRLAPFLHAAKCVSISVSMEWVFITKLNKALVMAAATCLLFF